MRKYKTGTAWCCWRWTEVDSDYITRLHVVKTPWWSVCIHWIKKPDPEPYLHDHPVTFLSIILRGEYVEHRTWWSRLGPVLRVRRVRRRWWNWITASLYDCHTIVECDPRTVTLCFMGKKIRDWGFHTPDGWVMWQDYYARQRAERN